MDCFFNCQLFTQVITVAIAFGMAPQNRFTCLQKICRFYSHSCCQEALLFHGRSSVLEARLRYTIVLAWVLPFELHCNCLVPWHDYRIGLWGIASEDKLEQKWARTDGHRVLKRLQMFMLTGICKVAKLEQQPNRAVFGRMKTCNNMQASEFKETKQHCEMMIQNEVLDCVVCRFSLVMSWSCLLPAGNHTTHADRRTEMRAGGMEGGHWTWDLSQLQSFRSSFHIFFANGLCSCLTQPQKFQVMLCRTQCSLSRHNVQPQLVLHFIKQTNCHDSNALCTASASSQKDWVLNWQLFNHVITVAVILCKHSRCSFWQDIVMLYVVQTFT